MRLTTAVACILFAVVSPSPSGAQTMNDQPASTAIPEATLSEDPAAPLWIATVSGGAVQRDNDAVRPSVALGLSRRLGRGYVRASVTTFRSALRQIDAVLPSTYVVGSLGAGGTFGRWFVDGSFSGGRQSYGGVTTPLGTRASMAGNGSAIYGASISGGRFISLSRRLYFTPSAALKYSSGRVLRSSLGPQGPVDYETREKSWTASATLRVDRYFGASNQHLAGLSVSRVESTNGATILVSTSTGGAAAENVADGWFVAGASTSLRVAPRFWVDVSATRTVAARSGDYTLASVGVRIGF